MSIPLLMIFSMAGFFVGFVIRHLWKASPESPKASGQSKEKEIRGVKTEDGFYVVLDSCGRNPNCRLKKDEALGKAMVILAEAGVICKIVTYQNRDTLVIAETVSEANGYGNWVRATWKEYIYQFPERWKETEEPKIKILT